MLVSKYGFSDVLVARQVVLDPSRVAAQIVTGIGFIGAGLIFVRGGSVRGLTSAASVWVTAAVGAAAGAGLPLVAAAGAVAYFLVAVAFAPLVHHVLRSSAPNTVLRVRYADGQGLLRQVLEVATDHGFVVAALSTEPGNGRPQDFTAGRPTVEVALQLHGRRPLAELAAALSEIEGVRAIVARDVDAEDR
jgi:putative Mg2+ transporter-C (MgtC) family protein